MPMRRRSVASASLRQGRDVVAEQGDQAARRLQRQEQQPQQRGLAGAGRAGEELERMRLDAEGEVAQDLRPQAVAQADILESDHARLRQCLPGRRMPGRPAGRCPAVRGPRCPELRFYRIITAPPAPDRRKRRLGHPQAAMVSGPLTVGC